MALDCRLRCQTLLLWALELWGWIYLPPGRALCRFRKLRAAEGTGASDTFSCPMGSPSSREFHLGLGSKLQAKEFCLRMQYLCLFLHAQGPARHHWSALVKYQQLLVTFGNPKYQQNQQQKIIKLFRKKNWISHLFISWITDVWHLSSLCHQSDLKAAAAAPLLAGITKSWNGFGGKEA